MAAGFKAADSFHVKPVFTTQQHTQPDALWYQHPLLPLQEVAFDSWTAGSKKKKYSKKTTGSKIIKVFHCAASKPGAFHVKLLVPRIRSHSPLTSESPPNVPRLRHIYSRTFLSFVASDHLMYTERTQHEHLPSSLASPPKLWSSKGLQYTIPLAGSPRSCSFVERSSFLCLCFPIYKISRGQWEGEYNSSKEGRIRMSRY